MAKPESNNIADCRLVIHTGRGLDRRTRAFDGLAVQVSQSARAQAHAPEMLSLYSNVLPVPLTRPDTAARKVAADQQVWAAIQAQA